MTTPLIFTDGSKKFLGSKEGKKYWERRLKICKKSGYYFEEEKYICRNCFMQDECKERK